MDTQTIINILIGLAGSCLGWMLNVVWQAVKDLQAADCKLTDKVAKIEVLVAGEYVTRNDFGKMSDAIFAKLDRIEDKLDGKADK